MLRSSRLLLVATAAALVGTSVGSVAPAAATGAPPVAVADSVVVPEGGTATTLVGGATSVLTNDTDPESDAMLVEGVTGPQHGTLTLNADGTFTYVHNGGETSSDSFIYRAYDGTSFSAAATVSITVTPVNDAPVAVDDDYDVNEDGTLTVTAASRVTLNDTDAEDDPLTVELVSSVQHGTLTLNANGTFTYLPDAGYAGTDSFTYQVDDGRRTSNVATVTITVAPVNDAPVAVAESLTVAEGGTATALDGAVTSVLANDIDPENDVLSAVLVTGPSRGTLTLDPDGTFTYIHNGSETTTDSFTYRANDGTSNSNTATVTITVTPVNDAPVARNDTYSVDEGATLTATSASRITLNDTDAENNPLTVLLVSDVDHGTLVLNANGTFTYTPTAGFSGTDSFTYQANDDSTSSNVATVTITVNSVNDAPTAVADSLTVAEGGTATTLSGGATSVLINDFDPEDDVLTAAVVAEPDNGTLTLNPNGTFSYVHDGSETTTDSFTYRANDGTSNSNVVTVTITVTPVDDSPVAVDNAYSLDENTTLTVTHANRVTLNDTDAESSPLTVLLVSDVEHGTLTLNTNGTFTYTPNAGYSGSDDFTYRANDGSTNSNVATVTITVNPVNDPPTAVADSVTVAEGGTATTLTSGATSVLINDADADDDLLTAELVSEPDHGTVTLNDDGTFSYTHDGSETTTDSFTYRADDGATTSDTVTVTITVTPVNDAPAAVGDSITVTEGETATTLTSGATSVLANDTDAESDPLTAAVVSDPDHGTLTLNPNGTFSFTPTPGYSGPDSFTYRAHDGGLGSNVATVTITVTAVNDAPVAVADSATVAEGGTVTTLSGGATSVLANDTDQDDDDLTAELVDGPDHGSLTLDPDGTFSYTHDGGETAADSFTYLADDGTATSATVTVELTVTPVNDVPGVRDDAFTTAEDTQLVVTLSGVLSNDTDAESDALTAVLVGGPAHGTLTLGTNGTFSYTPAADYAGSDSFTYRADDGTARSGVATVSLSVAPVNDAPVVSRLKDRVVREDGRTDRLAFTVSDDAAVSELRVSAGTDNARLVPKSAIRVTGSGADRQVQVAPASGRWGTAVITLRVVDAAGATAATSFTLTVLRGRACTIRGTAGHDVLVGTRGPDVICGLGGDDVIRGLGGDDELRGGPGDNRLVGGAGDDVLLGRDGDDTLLGGAGDDVLLGRAGDDVLDGGSGSNTLIGGAGRDVVRRTA